MAWPIAPSPSVHREPRSRLCAHAYIVWAETERCLSFTWSLSAVLLQCCSDASTAHEATSIVSDSTIKSMCWTCCRSGPGSRPTIWEGAVHRLNRGNNTRLRTRSPTVDATIRGRCFAGRRPRNRPFKNSLTLACSIRASLQLLRSPAYRNMKRREGLSVMFSYP